MGRMVKAGQERVPAQAVLKFSGRDRSFGKNKCQAGRMLCSSALGVHFISQSICYIDYNYFSIISICLSIQHGAWPIILDPL